MNIAIHSAINFDGRAILSLQSYLARAPESEPRAIRECLCPWYLGLAISNGFTI